MIIRDGGPPPFDPFDWRTDFSIRSVEWSEILSGGPPKDGIPAIDDPQFESIAAAFPEQAATFELQKFGTMIGPAEAKKPAGLNFVFKIAPADPQTSFDFEDVADK